LCGLDFGLILGVQVVHETNRLPEGRKIFQSESTLGGLTQGVLEVIKSLLVFRGKHARIQTIQRPRCHTKSGHAGLHGPGIFLRPKSGLPKRLREPALPDPGLFLHLPWRAHSYGGQGCRQSLALRGIHPSLKECLVLG
jgi:hypothetical protein